MDYIDYCQKLGLGFNDKKKQDIFTSRIQVFLQAHSDISFDEKQETQMCYNIGAVCKLENIDPFDLDFSNTDPTGLQRVWLYLSDRKTNFPDFLASLIVFYNGYPGIKKDKKVIFDAIQKALVDSHIEYELLWENNDVFVFPKGAKELDDALVSEPLEWLSSYPKARTAWIKALKDYSDQTDENASDIADKFRKALETFFQDFFNSEKSLENYKTEYGDYLKSKSIPAELSGNFLKLLESYTNYINGYAKHHDKTSRNVLEYIMYQTGNIMRLLITLNQENT